MSRKLLWFGLPLVLLGLLSFLVLRGDTLRSLARGLPPVEELTIDHVRLAPGRITVFVVNGGPDPVTLSQVIVDEAFWAHTVTPAREIPRLGRATVEIPYPWVEAEPVHLSLVTSNGITFDHEVAVAAATPAADTRYFLGFSLVGLYVGVLPVAIGLLWLPFLKRLEPRWIHFALALTAGLLVFLAFEALVEALETADAVAGAFQGTGIVALTVLGTWLALQAFGGAAKRQPGAGGPADRLRLAFLIALGIGLHNLGEGLAIGSAYAVGSLALGASLVVGFALHNTTEGLAIVAPVANERAARVRRLVLLGLIAGAPAILGAWIGASAYQPGLAALMFGIGAGAIAQVVVQIAPHVRDRAGRLLHPLAVGGLLTGLAVMYVTGLLISI
jgi:zinc transporter ZupT